MRYSTPAYMLFSALIMAIICFAILVGISSKVLAQDLSPEEVPQTWVDKINASVESGDDVVLTSEDVVALIGEIGQMRGIITGVEAAVSGSSVYCISSGSVLAHAAIPGG